MIKSLNKSLLILNYISSKKNVSVTELAAHFDIDKSSVSKILSTFAANNYVRKNPSNMKYSIDWGVLSLAYRFFENTNIFSEAYSPLLQLSAVTGDIAHLCTVFNGQIVPILSVNSSANTIKRNHYIPGIAVPLHCTSFGKVLYAFSKDTQKRNLLDNCDFENYTDNTTDKESFIKNADLIKEQGFAVSDGEFSPNVSSVAVPVFTNGHYASFAISVSGGHDVVSKSPFYHNNVAYPSRINAILYFAKKVSIDLSNKLSIVLEQNNV